MKCLKIDLKLSRGIALGLIIFSFVLYAVIPFNVCLPFSTCIIVGITGAMMIISEIVFWIGSLMIGKEVAIKIRKKISFNNVIKKIRKKD